MLGPGRRGAGHRQGQPGRRGRRGHRPQTPPRPGPAHCRAGSHRNLPCRLARRASIGSDTSTIRAPTCIWHDIQSVQSPPHLPWRTSPVVCDHVGNGGVPGTAPVPPATPVLRLIACVSRRASTRSSAVRDGAEFRIRTHRRRRAPPTSGTHRPPGPNRSPSATGFLRRPQLAGHAHPHRAHRATPIEVRSRRQKGNGLEFRPSRRRPALAGAVGRVRRPGGH